MVEYAFLSLSLLGFFLKSRTIFLAAVLALRFIAAFLAELLIAFLADLVIGTINS